MSTLNLPLFNLMLDKLVAEVDEVGDFCATQREEHVQFWLIFGQLLSDCIKQDHWKGDECALYLYAYLKGGGNGPLFRLGRGHVHGLFFPGKPCYWSMV